MAILLYCCESDQSNLQPTTCSHSITAISECHIACAAWTINLPVARILQICFHFIPMVSVYIYALPTKLVYNILIQVLWIRYFSWLRLHVFVSTEVISSTLYIWQLYICRMDWLHIVYAEEPLLLTQFHYPIPHSYPHLEKFRSFLLNTQLGWMNGAMQWLHSNNQICRSLNTFWLPWFHTLFHIIGQFH